MDINVQYDVSVKSVVLILVERSPIYQQLMGKYVLDVQLILHTAMYTCIFWSTVKKNVAVLKQILNLLSRILSTNTNLNFVNS